VGLLFFVECGGLPPLFGLANNVPTRQIFDVSYVADEEEREQAPALQNSAKSVELKTQNGV
jgi:hypothetical protein